MSRIVLSYASVDRELTSRLAAFLEARGHDVWWDTDLIGGDSYRSVIDRKLDEADVVIVIWTPASVRSEWVIAEADHAERQSKLLPVRQGSLLPWQIPKPFSNFQTVAIADAARIVHAVEHIASRAGSAEPVGNGAGVAEQALVRSGETSAENLIRGLVAALGVGFMLLAVVAARRRFLGVLDFEAKTFNFAVLFFAVAIVAAVAAVCSVLSRRTLNPRYNALLTYTGANLGVHVALLVSPLVAYGGLDAVDDTVFAAAGAVAVFAVLLLLQLLGAGWAYPAALFVAAVQLLANGFLLHSQSGRPDAWWIGMEESLLHFLYVATGLSSVAIATVFLVASGAYARAASTSG